MRCPLEPNEAGPHNGWSGMGMLGAGCWMLLPPFLGSKKEVGALLLLLLLLLLWMLLVDATSICY